jgi:single-stranded-DNA-specific exonuclease
MFEAMLEWRADEYIPSTKRGCKGQVEKRTEQAGRTAINVKNRQKRAQDASLENIESIIAEQDLLQNKILLVPVAEGAVDKNLAGLIANQLAAKYAKPTLILRHIINDDGTITYEGSGRNYGKSRLENLRQFCNETGLVMYAEGHASAFGIGITEENLLPFIEKTNELLKDFDFTPCYFVDLILDWNKISDNEIFNIASYNDIWGQQLDEPLIAFTNIPVNKENIAFLGNNERTLRITLPERKTNMIKFNMKDEQKALLDPGDGTLTLTVIGKCDLNHYMGNATPQIKIEDYEIMKRVIWDF